MDNYRKRIVDKLLERKLKSSGAVLIQGPKWCGKTTTALQLAKSSISLNDPSQQAIASQFMEIDPRRILKGETPRLIDEWQLEPRIWDAVRAECDDRGELGQFILTGSAVPVETDKIKHSGVGRFSIVTMHSMSLYESGDSTGQVSLKSLFDGNLNIDGESKIDIKELAFLACRGGWPLAVNSDREIALEQAENYYDMLVNFDICRVDNIRRNPEYVKRLLRSLARHQGSQTSYEAISQDIGQNEDAPLNKQTVNSYMNALKKIFVEEDLPAWSPNLVSKTAIITSPTLYFSDPSLATVSLDIGPEDLNNDPNTFGFIFETLCMRDLRVYSQGLKGSVYHYRDKTDLECDAVIHLRNGKYGLIEIKIGGESAVEAAAENLKKLESRLDTDKMSTPSFLMVLTGIGQFAYRRKDGVLVVPIGTLKD